MLGRNSAHRPGSRTTIIRLAESDNGWASWIGLGKVGLSSRIEILEKEKKNWERVVVMCSDGIGEREEEVHVVAMVLLCGPNSIRFDSMVREVEKSLEREFIMVGSADD